MDDQEPITKHRTLSQYLTEKAEELTKSVAAKAANTDMGQRYIKGKIDQAVTDKQVEFPKQQGFKGDLAKDPRIKAATRRAFIDWIQQEGNLNRVVPLAPKYLGKQLGKAGEWAKENPGKAAAIATVASTPLFIAFVNATKGSKD